MIDPWWAAAIAAASVAIGDQVNRRVVGWLPDDPPRPGRKSHGRPIPLAGVLLVPAIATWCGVFGAWLLLAAVLVSAAVGFDDDRRKEHAGPLDDGGLDWRIKAAGLFVAAGLVATATVDPLQQPGSWLLVFGGTFVLTNAVNFLDNTDGVAAGLSAAMLLLLGFAALPDGSTRTITLAAGFAACGFLPFNWPKPRLFLGDGGAYALGLCTSYAAAQALLLDPDWLLAVAVPLCDFTQVVVARLVIGVPPWVGDRRHLTHIVQNAGLHRTAVAPLFVALAAGVGAIALAI
ncbi:MAG: MraY family glycosyltransferase [Planctomycetota bacterium]